ncbi:hypothetical protein [Pseudogracilibacillus auburnensis]|uniref:hypothetical protein n=1 Tax=Pseudogracilibacillus auburnensis TaxID=1494959 RepID=UPI001A97BFFB|nr:hypothetical protein [Pseudogracilibacillus auburnensis]MBO1005763.1 hypothetical protein [Pseudogracilibacillus auburnensis]
MNAAILKKQQGFILEKGSPMYQNIEHTLFKVTRGETKEMQEIYDVLYGWMSIREAFHEFKDWEGTAKAKDETDPEQLYIKGIVDGMQAFWTLMNAYGESFDEFKSKKGEKTHA